MELRNLHLDFFRGLGVVSVVLIHTTYCSGESYVPQYMRNVSLFFDVGIFFFATGLTGSYMGKINAISQIKKIIFYFFSFSVIYTIFFDFSLSNLINPLFLVRPEYKEFEIIAVSYWFIPTYACVLIFSSAIIFPPNNPFRKIALLVIPIYYLIIYFYKPLLPYTAFFGIDINMMLYYTWLLILGFTIMHNCLIPTDKNKVAFYIGASTLLISSYALIYLFYDEEVFELQKFKFPTQFPYILVTLGFIFILFIISYQYKNKLIEFLGRNAIVCYIAQGISSSLVFKIVPVLHFSWHIKFAIIFFINMTICTLLSLILIKYFQLILKIKTSLHLKFLPPISKQLPK